MHTSVEWDESKNQENKEKHGISFEIARYAFLDTYRVIAQDSAHSNAERRFYCFGKVKGGVLTVRFTYKNSRVRIIGAGFWRKGRKMYEKENQIY